MRYLRFVVMTCLVWWTLSVIVTDHMRPGESNLFAIGLVYSCALLLGIIFSALKMGPVTGFLLAGVILANIQRGDEK
jgi:predicted Kef-type K+ transport protein